jgi:hypothetical protein
MTARALYCSRIAAICYVCDVTLEEGRYVEDGALP